MNLFELLSATGQVVQPQPPPPAASAVRASAPSATTLFCVAQKIRLILKKYSLAWKRWRAIKAGTHGYTIYFAWVKKYAESSNSY
jgi:hypothetical protein